MSHQLLRRIDSCWPCRFVSESCFALLTLASVAMPRAEAQPPRRQPTPNDTLKSTEVSADHKVTFRIYAPKASEVSVSGDFGPGGKLTKDEKGVWSITVGPLTPDFYSYTFRVDGVRTIDPKNATIKQGIASLESMFLLPGEESAFEAAKDVPHGEIHIAWYRSGTLDALRSMHVYTPPGYEGGSEKYPVFYLLHGAGDEDSGWSTIGRAGFILDNLLADNKAVPMIVVMPNGSMPRPANMPRFVPGTTADPRGEGRDGSLPEPVHRRAAQRGCPLRREALPREDGSRESSAGGTIDGRRPDLAGRHDSPGRVRLPGRLERRRRWRSDRRELRDEK